MEVVEVNSINTLCTIHSRISRADNSATAVRAHPLERFFCGRVSHQRNASASLSSSHFFLSTIEKSAQSAEFTHVLGGKIVCAHAYFCSDKQNHWQHSASELRVHSTEINVRHPTMTTTWMASLSIWDYSLLLLLTAECGSKLLSETLNALLIGSRYLCGCFCASQRMNIFLYYLCSSRRYLNKRKYCASSVPCSCVLIHRLHIRILLKDFFVVARVLSIRRSDRHTY